MGDEEDGEPKYQMFVPGSDVPRAEGSKAYTGDGKAFYVNGDKYEGTFVEGYRRGKGKYTFKKFGDTYEGHYEENKKHGFGKMTYLNQPGEDEEEGEERPPRGGTYLGYFTKGDRGCQARDEPAEATVDGTFTYLNGDVYSGAWCGGKKHGKGTYSYAKDGTKLVGEFENGKIVSGKWIFPNGTFYSGQFRYNKPFGKGVWVFKNGNQLTGEYEQKEQPNEDEGGGGDEEEGAVKPDPKVWCIFKHGRDVAVQGGTMTMTSKYPPKGYPAAA
eukprot:gnl/TRDRNA2_/TRDRNA2_178461_c0_seq1.p2 gnl/TRDRNA2_/TRDRNA2_178461_c0~~gnl/TRDRNA2_/TRDRNA2_178461_c0_seq1.p2  ORF type:complete len:272 (+),score=75.63 gnl/TRDRNA2_/TRDRNA2_178461_c0_seq1:95-910(+)